MFALIKKIRNSSVWLCRYGRQLDPLINMQFFILLDFISSVFAILSKYLFFELWIYNFFLLPNSKFGYLDELYIIIFFPSHEKTELMLGKRIYYYINYTEISHHNGSSFPLQTKSYQGSSRVGHLLLASKNEKIWIVYALYYQ